jgi:hypothetical protein
VSEKYSIAQDLKEAEAMVKSLVPYVYEDALYGSAGSGGLFSSGSLPSLTIGALLMRIRRLSVLRDQLNTAQINRLGAIEQRNREVQTEWRVHYEQKMAREAKSRLDAMSTFFQECNDDPGLCARVYKPEASRRTIAQEIMIAMEQMGIKDDEVNKKARSTDSKLRRYVQPSGFLWAAELQPAYPEDVFWWLYFQPPA